MVPNLGPWCDGLGGGAFDTASGFSLTAFRTSGDSTGIPIITASSGSTSQINSGVLADPASLPSPASDFTLATTFNLSEGKLLPSPNFYNQPVADIDVQPGNAISFAFSNTQLPAAAQVYCAAAITDANGGFAPILALHNDVDSFSICTEKFGNHPMNLVVYKASADSESFDFSTCFPVKLQLVGV
ncbi:hypothetical protein K474DRAFT_1597602 [Panus rudis PR-1116 ss-1]|nr:hypothetical protein K474DRAFT_1597602 [Panus rudis PR-1116 ss-1]